jgi:hypothetical protein
MSGKIGIFLPGQNGDIMSAMSVLKYFKRFFLENPKYANQNLIFPLPKLETT